MKQWGVEVLLLILIGVCGCLLVIDVRNAYQAHDHYHQMQRTTDYYSRIYKEHLDSKTNSVVPFSAQHPGN
jgi:hypothetical protein